MKKLLLAVFCLLSSVSLFAAQDLESNWQTDAVEGQNRTITDDSNIDNPLAIVGGGSFEGNATGNTLTVDSKNISISDATAAEQAYNPSRASLGAYVAGGAALNAEASQNTLTIKGTTLTGRDAYGGSAVLRDPQLRMEYGSANNNTVNIDGVTVKEYSFTTSGGGNATIGGNVYGGYSEYSKGSANNNTVNITNGSVIEGNVYGGMVDDQLTLEDLTEIEGALDSKANNNTVYVTGSTVNGTVAGAAGSSYADNNKVIIENSTVNTVLGVADNHGVQDADTSVVHVNNNSVIVKNSTINSAAAVDSRSINASGNSLTLDNSTFATGTNNAVYAVNMGMATSADSGNPVLALVENSKLTLNKMTGNLREIGGSLNLVGTANGNQINIQDSTLTLGNSSKVFMSGLLNSADLSGAQLLYLPDDKGLMFGGASMYYSSQTGTGEVAPEARELAVAGTNSDGNNILLKNGSFEGNIIGGMSAYIVEVDYEVITPNEEDPSKPTVETVVKTGLTTNSTTVSWEKDEGGVWQQKTENAEPQIAEKIDDVYSASNNTVVLDGVNFNGTIYGGYVYGAELKEKNMHTKNNKVILRGNVTLTPTSVLYGGSNDYYASTNELVFDRVKSTFNSMDQFQNFKNIWTINADFDTDLNFDFEGVYAKMNLAPGAMQEASKTVVTTQTTNDLTEIEQGAKIVDLTDNNISLNNNRLGVYTFDLSPTKGTGNTVEWTLTGKKDKANMEVYGQLPLVGLALASEGGELLTHSVTDAWKSDNEFSTFLNGAYHHTRYETGSGFDLDSALVQVGAWKKFNEEWLGGFFAKYSNGSYETYPIKVTGSANVFGGGLMTSYRYSETGRLEASLEAGYMDMDFESASLISSFNSKGMYYGASAGFVESLMQDLDLFANINWLRKGDDDITDNLGQKVTFDTMQSLNLRFGADYTLSNINWGGLIPSLGAMGIYEFDGESSVEIDGNKNSDASLKGMSGRGQISLAYQNNDSFLPLRTVFTAYGQLGNRRGFGGEVNISFEF